MRLSKLWTKTIHKTCENEGMRGLHRLRYLFIVRNHQTIQGLLSWSKPQEGAIDKHRTFLFLASCVVFCSMHGCSTEQKVVWIDWEKASRACAITKSAFYLPPPEIYAPPTSGRIPFLDIRRALSGTETRRNKALVLMESERMRVARDFEAAYSDRFMMEVEAMKNQLFDQLHVEATKRIQSIIEEISQWIRSEAQEVGEIKIRLALIEGYPKPRPRNPEVLRRSTVERMWADEAETLRRKLETLDESFFTKLRARLEEENIFWASEISRIEELMKKTRLEAQNIAKALAQQHIAETGRLQLPVLLDAAELQRVAEPEIRVDLQGLSIKPRWKETPIIEPPLNTILKTKLDIWLSVHGYKLAKSPKEGEDKTLEFIAWLNRNKAGP